MFLIATYIIAKTCFFLNLLLLRGFSLFTYCNIFYKAANFSLTRVSTVLRISGFSAKNSFALSLP